MARQNFIGLVVSQGKMNKTVKVQVESKSFNRIINKEIAKRKNYLVHDEGNIAREGDVVRIELCRPLSAKKRFAIAEIRKNQGSQFAKYDEIAKKQVLEEENLKTRDFLQRREQTNKEIQENTSLISDLSLIHKNAVTPLENLSDVEIAKVEELKEKYGIKSWPPSSQALELEIQNLSSQIESLQKVITYVEPSLEILLKDEYTERVDKALQNYTQKDVNSLKKNTRKNLLRKYLLKNSSEAEREFGDVLGNVNTI